MISKSHLFDFCIIAPAPNQQASDERMLKRSPASPRGSSAAAAAGAASPPAEPALPTSYPAREDLRKCIPQRQPPTCGGGENFFYWCPWFFLHLVFSLKRARTAGWARWLGSLQKSCEGRRLNLLKQEANELKRSWEEERRKWLSLQGR